MSNGCCVAGLAGWAKGALLRGRTQYLLESPDSGANTAECVLENAVGVVEVQPNARTDRACVVFEVLGLNCLAALVERVGEQPVLPVRGLWDSYERRGLRGHVARDVSVHGGEMLADRSRGQLRVAGPQRLGDLPVFFHAVFATSQNIGGNLSGIQDRQE